MVDEIISTDPNDSLYKDFIRYLCECNDIEDEYPFILICPVYRHIRSVIINVLKLHCLAICVYI